MTLQRLYYLEYLCAFLTPFLLSCWMYYINCSRYYRARREAGALRGIFRKRLVANILLFFVFPLVLLGLHLWMYFCRDSILSPLALSCLAIFFFLPFDLRWTQPTLEIRERGLIDFGKERKLFIPWEDIVYCQWIESTNQLKLHLNYSTYSNPLSSLDAPHAIGILGRFVEVRNEQGEVIHSGLPKPSSSESDAAKPNRSPAQNPFQFSILSMLLLTVIVAAASGWYAVVQEYRRQQQKALDTLSAFAPSISMDFNGAVGSLDFFTPLFPNIPPPAIPNLTPPAPANAPQKITDKDIALLRPFHRLTRLYLSFSGITDAAITDLITLQSLKSLSIIGTNISPEGVEHLRKEMPNTEISY